MSKKTRNQMPRTLKSRSRTRWRAASRLPSARFPPSFALRCISLHGRSALALEVADLEGVHGTGLAEEIPRRFGRAGVLGVPEIRGRDHVEVLVRDHVDRGLHDVLVAAGHHEGRTLREFGRKELERGRNEQDARFDRDRLTRALARRFAIAFGDLPSELRSSAHFPRTSDP